jgi:hypothetical protein
MENVSAPRRRRNGFDFTAKHRREIVLHARHVGAGDTEDLDRWLIAWVWHNRKAADQIWSVINAARNMGREITEAEASAITEEASICRKHLSADNLARFLGVTYAQRQALGLTTIGSINVKKRARKELRKRKDRLYQEGKRRAAGARPHSQSLSQTKPWEALNMSRRTWERRRNKARDANDAISSAAIFLSTDDRLASLERKRGIRERPKAAPPKAANLMVADRYGALPMELRLLALGLGPENFARDFSAAA